MVITGVLLAHLIEICLFAVGFFLLHAQLGLGAIAGHFEGTVLDYFYFSAALLTRRWVWAICSPTRSHPIGCRSLKLLTGFSC